MKCSWLRQIRIFDSRWLLTLLFIGGRSSNFVEEGRKVQRRFSDRPDCCYCSEEMETVLWNSSTKSGCRIRPANICSGWEEDSKNSDWNSPNGHLGWSEDYCRGRRLAKGVSISGTLSSKQIPFADLPLGRLSYIISNRFVWIFCCYLDSNRFT